MKRTLPLALIAALNVGCQSGPLKDIKIFERKPASGAEGAAPGAEAAPPITAEQRLAKGVGLYEDGAYKEAMQDLQTALDTGLTQKDDQVKAHKYLAFIHCASSQEKRCREEFTKVLEINPKFELVPAEAGHPVWGRVFRSVKKGMSQKK